MIVERSTISDGISESRRDATSRRKQRSFYFHTSPSPLTIDPSLAGRPSLPGAKGIGRVRYLRLSEAGADVAVNLWTGKELAREGRLCAARTWRGAQQRANEGRTVQIKVRFADFRTITRAHTAAPRRTRSGRSSGWAGGASNCISCRNLFRPSFPGRTASRHGTPSRFAWLWTSAALPESPSGAGASPILFSTSLAMPIASAADDSGRGSTASS